MSQLDRPAVHPAFSIPSILAIVAAIGSFVVAPGQQFLLGIAAGIFGLIGVIIAILPGKRGGLISILSIVLGGIALLIAIVRALAH